MPISRDILDKLRRNDPSLVHLDLTSQVKLYLSYHPEVYIPLLNDESERLTDQYIIELCEALTHNTHLESLNLNKNIVSVIGITALLATPITSLSLRKNGLNSACIDALMLSERLLSLDVSSNILSDESVAKLASHPNLISLDASNNIVGPLAM